MKPPFDTVVRTHGATVLRVCRAAVSVDDADDVWSETFLAALRAYPALPADANAEAWLVTIAHRKAIDHHRARVRRALPTDELPEEVGHAPDPAERLDVVAAVAGLPERQRLAVAYHHLAGLPWEQVAAVIGGTSAAARRAGSDGLARLRASGRLDQGENR